MPNRQAVPEPVMMFVRSFSTTSRPASGWPPDTPGMQWRQEVGLVMPRPRPKLLRILALGLFVGFMARRLRQERTALAGRFYPVPTPSRQVEESSVLTRFIRRHGLVELATLVALPLALFGLLFTALATRDTARQLEISNRQLSFAQAQIQPVFKVSGHQRIIGETNGIPRLAFDQLAVNIEGGTREAGAIAMSAFGMLNRDNSWSAAPIWWWNDATPRHGEIARWTANPKLLKPLLRDKSVVNGTHLGTIINIRYVDLVGGEHEVYFALAETFSAINGADAVPQLVSESYGPECNELMTSLLPGSSNSAPHPVDATRSVTVARLRASSSKLPYAAFARCVGQPKYELQSFAVVGECCGLRNRLQSAPPRSAMASAEEPAGLRTAIVPPIHTVVRQRALICPSARLPLAPYASRQAGSRGFGA
jgi:hypothetical protein